jgi:hypothetical protein
MDNLTRAACLRLLIGLRLADEGAVELQQRTAEHDCDEGRRGCQLCTLHRDALALHFHLPMYHDLTEGNLSWDDGQTAEAHGRELRALLDRLLQVPPAEEPTSSGQDADGATALIPPGAPPGHPRNYPGQERLLAALRDACDACDELEDAVARHACRPDPLHGCHACDLAHEAKGMWYTLDVFRSLIDSVTVRSFAETCRDLRDELVRLGDPVPPAIAAAAERLTNPAADPLYVE